jgi:hypothetical protein
MEKIIVDEIIPRDENDFKVVKLNSDFMDSILYPIDEVIEETLKMNIKCVR